MSRVRQPAVAGTFYPDEPAVLRAQVTGLLDDAAPRELPGPVEAGFIKALIAPHAGYVYSGPVAASAYAPLRAQAARIRRVVLLGPCHRVAVHGLALPACDVFRTPLGDVPVDADAVARLRRLPQVVESAAAHAHEHSLEVHVPFLQRALGAFTLVPLAVGLAAPRDVAEVLELLWGGDETLIVVSSDLSHFLPYDDARQVDGTTIARMLELSPTLVGERACGAAPVNGLLVAAQRHGLAPVLLDLRNSGDTAGPRDRVVGYASLAFVEPARAAEQDDDGLDDGRLGAAALAHARSAIAEQLAQPAHAAPDHAGLARDAATFVTLRRHGQLRGCVGSLQPVRTLRADVRHNAVAAGFRDPRFAPLSAADLDGLAIEISLLSALEPLFAATENDAIAQLVPGRDGVLFECRDRRATLLPQVWDDLADPYEFLAQLKRKAGFGPTFWSRDVRVSRYTVTKWRGDWP